VIVVAQTPINLRLSAERLRELELRARARNMPLRTLAQRYLEEGMRIEAHPLVRFVDGPYGRSAVIVGTDFDVWQVIRHMRNDNARDAAKTHDEAGTIGLTEVQIKAAQDYYTAFRDEIDGQLELVAINTRSTRDTPGTDQP
jgi:hypothetical protein